MSNPLAFDKLKAGALSLILICYNILKVSLSLIKMAFDIKPSLFTKFSMVG